jgi:threonine dehydrogenase-like Zn-dependent dehydrogenase
MRASELAPKPRTVDHVGAAALVLAGLTAWQGLFDHARLASGQRVLILGAAGAVGAVAVQLAHWRRAHVIGTACARHRDFLRGLGADEVIDPTSARFDDKGWDADVVLDVVGGNTLDRPRPRDPSGRSPGHPRRQCPDRTARPRGSPRDLVHRPAEPRPARRAGAARRWRRRCTDRRARVPARTGAGGLPARGGGQYTGEARSPRRRGRPKHGQRGSRGRAAAPRFAERSLR